MCCIFLPHTPYLRYTATQLNLEMTSLYESLILKLANVVELATQDQGAFTPQAKQALVRSVRRTLRVVERCAHDSYLDQGLQR